MLKCLIMDEDGLHDAELMKRIEYKQGKYYIIISSNGLTISYNGRTFTPWSRYHEKINNVIEPEKNIDEMSDIELETFIRQGIEVSKEKLMK